MKMAPVGFLMAVIGGAALTQSVCGAVVSWGTAQNIATPAEVSLSGTLLDAMEIYTGGSAVSVNSVPFSTASSATNNLGTGGAVKLTSNGAGKIIVTTDAQAGSSISLGDANYTSLLGTFSYTNSNNAVFLSGLISGRSYLVQVWASQNTLSPNYPTLAGSPSVELNVNTGGGVGQFAIGTFVAGGTTDNFAFGPVTGTYADLNAIQVRLLPVPEPNAFVLIGFGITGFAAIVRRRRA